MALLCVDASVVISWLIPSERSNSVAQTMAAYLRGEDELVAPPLLLPEVVSTVRRWVYQRRLTEDEGDSLIRDMLRLDIDISAPHGLYLRAYQLASQFNQPRAYDACYLALADLLSCDFVTLDQRLYHSTTPEFRWIRLLD